MDDEIKGLYHTIGKETDDKEAPTATQIAAMPTFRRMAVPDQMRAGVLRLGNGPSDRTFAISSTDDDDEDAENEEEQDANDSSNSNKFASKGVFATLQRTHKHDTTSPRKDNNVVKQQWQEMTQNNKEYMDF
jgi:hypothetical protein